MLRFFEMGDSEVLWKRRLRFDFLLFFLVLLTMAGSFTANPIHETLGILLTLAFVLHVLLNRFWCKKKTLALIGKGNRPLRRREKILYALNLLMAGSFLLTIATGILGSQTLFPRLAANFWHAGLTIRYLHLGFAMWFFFLAAIHLGLHASFLFAKKIASLQKALGVRGYCVSLSVLTFVGIVFSIFAAVKREAFLLFFFQNLTIPLQRGESAWHILAELSIFFATVILALMLLESLKKRKNV